MNAGDHGAGCRSSVGWSVLQPCVNFDSVTTDAIAWFVAKGPAQLGTNYVPGPIQYGRLKWTNGTPQFLENPWNNSLNPPAYYDLDYAGFTAPQQPDGTNNQALALSTTGSRLTMAVVRSNALWTCHHVGLNSQGGYNGEAQTALRSGCQWFRLQISSDGQSLTMADNNRVYDGSTSSPYFYFVPSLMVNSNGDMVMGFSGSRGTEHIGAFYTGRLANGSVPDRPVLIQAGRHYFGTFGWGDYSYTSLDPVDSTFWTVQLYAETLTSDDKCPPGATCARWGTWVVKINK